MSGVPQGSVLGPLIFVLYTNDMFYLVESKLFVYDDESKLMASSVTEVLCVSLNRDLAKIYQWCIFLEDETEF